MTQNRSAGREVVPIPDRRYGGLITYDAKDPVGNFPQAFSHLALILARMRDLRSRGDPGLMASRAPVVAGSSEADEAIAPAA